MNDEPQYFPPWVTGLEATRTPEAVFAEQMEAYVDTFNQIEREEDIRSLGRAVIRAAKRYESFNGPGWKASS